MLLIHKPGKKENPMNITTTMIATTAILAALLIPLGMTVATVFYEIVRSAGNGIAGWFSLSGKNNQEKV